MHIKQLTIHGFKSYRDQVVVGPFSPGHNVVVGRNGSGKSNFFAAIRFVLNDAYSKLGQEERQALLHEGTGQIAAYVEIVFDNGDGRFPTGKDEVVIRRTVGLKKDEYSLDRKPATKTDVMNLLQSAGFSRSNPYYIVPQGRITALTNAKDSDRLQLLKEVAGTRVYEEHREESLKIMKETEGKKAKIVELLGFIEERLGELEQEKDQLSEYFGADRERRACEFLLYSQELEKASDGLARLEEEYRSVLEADERAGEADAAHLERIRELEEQLSALKRMVFDLEGDREALLQDQEQVSKQKAQLELVIDDLEDDSRRFRGEEARIEQVLSQVEQQIAVKEEELGKVAPQVMALEQEEAGVRAELMTCAQKREALVAKRNRAGQFRSEADRNKWIQKELEALTTSKAHDEGQLANLGEDLVSFETKAADLKEAIEADHEDPIVRLQELDLAHQEARRQRDQATESRKELWRAQAKLETSLGSIDDEVGRLQREACAHASDKAALQATQHVMVVAERLGLSHAVFGPLYTLFQLEDAAFAHATDVIGGGSLFHVVVDSDETASALLAEMLREPGNGRVTLMPLNRLGREKALDFQATPEAVPLLDKLRYENVFESAMVHVFGKAVVCKDLHACSAVSKAHRVDTITLGGDRVSRKGALTGGSLAATAGHRLEALWKLSQWQAKRQEHQETLQEIRAHLVEVDQQVTAALGRMQLLDCQRSDLRLGRGSGSSEVAQRRTELASLQQIIASKRVSMAKFEEAIQAAGQKSASLQAELGSPFALSPQDLEQLESLTRQHETISTRYTAINSSLSAALQTQQLLEQELDTNLRRRRHQLCSQLAKVSTSHTAHSLRLHQEELAGLQERLDRIHAELKRVSEQAERHASDETLVASALDKARALVDSSEASSEQMVKYQAKRRHLLHQRNEAHDRVRSVGLVPEDALLPLRPLSPRALLDRLHAAKEQVRGCGPVNKKAAEQHDGFSRQGEALRKRLAELEASAQAIEDFIGVLDARKDEAITRTFEQVSAAFSEVFAKLVPTGHAGLHQVLAPDSLDLTGISIRAAFNSRSADEGLLLGQLSGGQKSLVSLALILAIQRTDPAPFYLFDEVDAALDAAHRTALAALLDDLAHPTTTDTTGAAKPPVQFICTTFRPELLQRADAFFGVSFGNRVSRVESIAKQQALDFIDTAANN